MKQRFDFESQEDSSEIISAGFKRIFPDATSVLDLTEMIGNLDLNYKDELEIESTDTELKLTRYYSPTNEVTTIMVIRSIPVEAYRNVRPKDLIDSLEAHLMDHAKSLAKITDRHRFDAFILSNEEIEELFVDRDADHDEGITAVNVKPFYRPDDENGGFILTTCLSPFLYDNPEFAQQAVELFGVGKNIEIEFTVVKPL